MRRLTLLAVAGLLVLTGCDAAQDAADNAVDSASQRARSEAEAVLTKAITDQVCAAVGDQRLSDSDIATISTLLDQADAAGVDAEALAPARAVVEQGQAKASDLKALQESCA
ncbi:hypothetical protein ACIB24_03750 [Spongisporangium articulatum]|uniref:Lipoprotein n=1 Tax=Spongisporangium articulatum TaxID=3362603 RepID=A0ABW8AII9_9ACTN